MAIASHQQHAQDGIERAPSSNPDVHRPLVVVDPPMQGRDVAAIQLATRDRLRARGIGAREVPVPEHGKFTAATALACIEAQYFLGLASETYLKRDGKHRVLTVGAQHIVRDPRTRTPEQLERARERRGQLERGPRYYEELAAKLGGAGKGVAAALAFADKQVGVQEQPAGSNWGPKIEGWIRTAGYTSPVPWCFGPGTLVNTPVGLRPIQQVRAGDLVMDAHGGVALVGAAHVRHADDRFRLVAHGVDATTVSGEHPYIVRRRLPNGARNRRAFGEPEWVAARDLSPGDLLAQPLLGGDMPMDEARAYLIGRWLADGWSVDRPSRYGRAPRTEHFLCGSHDERDELVCALDAAGLGYSERVYPTVVQFALRVDAAPLLQGCGDGAKTKRLPAHALMWHEAARRALMDGYRSGDGCAYGPVVRANSVSRELTLGMAQIARSVGHVVTMRAQDREPTAIIAGRSVTQASARFEMTFRPDGICHGRQQHLAGIDEHLWVPIRSVDEVRPGPVHNLTVSGESTFIADGYAVHNCGCFVNACIMAGGVPSGAGWIGYTPAIVSHAKAQTGGWSWHGPEDGKPGDLALFDRPGGDPVEHVEIVRAKIGPGRYSTYGGNTSDDNAGSQYNGDLVAQRNDRVTSGSNRIVGFARPPWK